MDFFTYICAISLRYIPQKSTYYTRRRELTIAISDEPIDLFILELIAVLVDFDLVRLDIAIIIVVALVLRIALINFACSLEVRDTLFDRSQVRRCLLIIGEDHRQFVRIGLKSPASAIASLSQALKRSTIACRNDLRSLEGVVAFGDLERLSVSYSKADQQRNRDINKETCRDLGASTREM